MNNDHFSQIFHIDDRATLAKKPRDRMNALIENPDTVQAVQALNPIEFYDLYHDVGPGDAMLLLEYASPEQVQTCLDLDIWRGDELKDSDLAPWGEALLAVPDEKFEEFWKSLDPEIMGLYLHRNVHLYMAPDKNDDVDIPDSESQNVAQSPDFTYWIAYPEDPDKAELLRQLIDRLYAVLGIEKAWSTLEAMHFEMESDLEENAYRFRTERIREYGFMPRHEAAAIFSNVDVNREAEAIRSETNGDLYVQDYPHTGKLDAALAALDQSKTSNCYFEHVLSLLSDVIPIKVQLFSIAQQVATYDGFQPHESQGFEDSMILSVAYISLGLEFASHHEDVMASQILSHIALRRIFALGYSLTVELQRKAKILISRGHLSIIDGQSMSLLTTSQRDAVEGMLLARPRPSSSALTPFISMHDIQASAAVIADVATRELFFGEALHKTRDDISLLAYTNELPFGVENVNFDNVAVTFLTRRFLKYSEPWGVFNSTSLPERQAVIQAISLENIQSLFKSSLNDSTLAALGRFAHQLLAQVEEQWPETQLLPDPRLVNAILIALPDED